MRTTLSIYGEICPHGIIAITIIPMYIFRYDVPGQLPMLLCVRTFIIV